MRWRKEMRRKKKRDGSRMNDEMLESRSQAGSGDAPLDRRGDSHGADGDGGQCVGDGG